MNLGYVYHVRGTYLMKVIDLFAGEGNWSRAFLERGHQVFTVDIDPTFGTTLIADVRELSVSDFPFRPDIILASPPCERFSVATIGKHWTPPPDNQPKTKEAREALELVEHTVDLIASLGPRFWVLENPVGKLRSLEVMKPFERRTITQCQYGRPYMKPTDLWGGFPPSLELRPPCKKRSPCHVSAPRGSKTGVQGRNRLETQAIPYALSLAVCLSAERDLGTDAR